MGCYLAESVGSRVHWLWDTARKSNGFLLSSTVSRSLQLLITLYHWSNSGGVFSKMYLSKIIEHFSQIENWKCHIFDFRLSSLNRITYCQTKINTGHNVKLTQNDAGDHPRRLALSGFKKVYKAYNNGFSLSKLHPKCQKITDILSMLLNVNFR